MTVDASRCPLCGNANACQLAAGQTTCWCFDTPIPSDALARIPPQARGLACVCRRCADGTTDQAHRRRNAMRWTRR